jgi:hypothetical protein
MTDYSDDSDIDGLAIRGLPAKVGNLTRGPVRASQYGELTFREIGLARYTLVDQGTYFVAHNATNDASTTLAGHADPELADCDATMTKPFIHMRLDSAATTRVYLDYIEIEIVTAPTTAARDNWAAQLDSGATRVTSGGTALTKINANMQSTAASSLSILGGAVVTGAESPLVRHLGHGQTRAAIPIAGDRYMFRFGEEPTPGDNIVASAASRHTINMPPVILGPADQFLLALYSADDATAAAGVYKVRCGWWEL